MSAFNLIATQQALEQIEETFLVPNDDVIKVYTCDQTGKCTLVITINQVSTTHEYDSMEEAFDNMADEIRDILEDIEEDEEEIYLQAKPSEHL